MVALTLLASGAACTKKNDQFADAGNSGGAADATSFDASLGPDAQAVGLVTVSVFVDEAPAEGVVVFTNAANGDYLTSGLTNANGIVKFESFPAGGAVTAAARAFGDFSTSDSKMLSTVTAVEVGETITFGRSKRNSPSGNGLPVVGALEITLPGLFTGATVYERIVACETRSGASAGASGSTIYDGCFFPNGTMDAVAYASDNTGHLAYSFGTAANLAGPTDNIVGSVVLPDWQTDLGTYAADLTESPQDELFAGVSFFGLNQGLAFGLGDLPPVLLQVGGSATMEIGIAPSFHDESVFIVAAQPGTPAQNSNSSVAFREDGGPAASGTITKSVNLTTELASLINNLEVSDTSPLEVTWDNASLACKDNPEPDGLIVIVAGTTASETYEWVMLTPGTTPSGIALPQIDSALAATLWPQDSFTETEAGLVFKGNSVQTYADLRTKTYNLSTVDLVPYLANSVQCMAIAGNLPR